MNRNRIIIRTSLLLLALQVAAGCADFLDVNTTPNNPTAVPPSTLLPVGLVGSAFANNNELNRFGSVVTSYWTGAVAGGSTGNYDTYVLTGNDFGNQWNLEIYGGALIAYRKMMAAADAVGSRPYAGIGKIMSAYTFALATDIWGDVPYSEALRGDEGLTQPRLDKQEDIYKGNAALGIVSLFDLIREGIEDLDAASLVRPGADDVVYGGNMVSWRKAGYTLMLKLALQMSRREPALATQIINEVFSANSMISANTENLAVKFGATTGSQSPMFTYTYVSLFQNDLIVSTRYINRLQALNDPRLDKWVTKPSGSFVTLDNGFRGNFTVPTANWSKFSTAIVGVNGVGPVRLITNAARCFMMAEAALTLPGITLPSGQTVLSLYQDGIRASMIDSGLTNAEVDAYFAANTSVVTLAGTVTEQHEKIMEQKYIANTGNGLEAWNDWRRTGLPNLPPHQNAAGEDGTRPLRAIYLSSEVARNPNFNPVEKSNVKVWWDVD